MKNNNLSELVSTGTEGELIEILWELEWDINIENAKKTILEEQIFLKINNIIDVEYKIDFYKSIYIPDDLMDQLYSVANDWFWIKMWKEDVKNHIYMSEDIFILKINWEVVWFSSLSHLWDFIYRFWTVIKKKFQANWLYKKLSKTIMNDSKKYFLRTQNRNVIKSLEESFDNVIYWRDAYELMTNNLDIVDIDNFLLNHWDSKETLNKDWIFKWVYGGKMWDKSRVNYVDKDFYEWFSPNEWDSLLVIYFNNK